MLNTHSLTQHIKSLKACLMQPQSVVCQLNYAEWSGIVFSAPSQSYTHWMTHTRKALSFSHRLNHMWLCISEAPLHVSSVVFSPRCVSVWSRVAGNHFKSALSVPDIKDTILSLFDHEKSLHIFRMILWRRSPFALLLSQSFIIHYEDLGLLI